MTEQQLDLFSDAPVRVVAAPPRTPQRPLAAEDLDDEALIAGIAEANLRLAPQCPVGHSGDVKAAKKARAPVLAAGGIVMRDASEPLIAIVRLRKGKAWVLPKGKLKPGEDAIAAAAREVKEETGHDVSVHEFLGSMANAAGDKHKVVQFWRKQLPEAAPAPDGAQGGRTALARHFAPRRPTIERRKRRALGAPRVRRIDQGVASAHGAPMTDPGSAVARIRTPCQRWRHCPWWASSSAERRRS